MKFVNLYVPDILTLGRNFVSCLFVFCTGSYKSIFLPFFLDIPAFKGLFEIYRSSPYSSYSKAKARRRFTDYKTKKS
jgi:hypothetical protein